MMRERALKVLLVLVGAIFVAGVYPLILPASLTWLAVGTQEKGQEVLQMMLSVYVTLGVFLLLAVRNPSAHRSLIAFTAWSSFAHAGVMAVQALHDVSERGHLLGGSLALVIVGVALIVLAPAKLRTAGTAA